MGHKPPTWLSYGGIGAGIVGLIVFVMSSPETAQAIFLNFLRWVMSTDSYVVVVIIWTLLILPLPVHLTVVYIYGQRKEREMRRLYRQHIHGEKDKNEQPIKKETETENGVVLRLLDNETGRRVSQK